VAIIQITARVAVKDEIHRRQLGGAIMAVLTVREVVSLRDQFGIE
jgi:hypothetical protein